MGSFLSKPKPQLESPKLIKEYLDKRQVKASIGPKIEVVVLPKEEEPKK